MYKNLSLVITIALSLSMSSCATATPDLSCRELSELVNDLDLIQVDFDLGPNIRAGSEQDMMLRDVVDAIGMIAEGEGDRSLIRAARELKGAYIDMDDRAFSSSLEQVTTIIDRINFRDCS
jgi:hypothetical protein